MTPYEAKSLISDYVLASIALAIAALFVFLMIWMPLHGLWGFDAFFGVIAFIAGGFVAWYNYLKIFR